MAKVKTKNRKTSVRIQIHMRLPVPKGYVLHPDLVTEIADGWLDGDGMEAGEVEAVDWEINGRKGQAPKTDGEVDQTGEVRQGLIERFRYDAFRTSFPRMGEGQNFIRGEFDE